MAQVFELIKSVVEIGVSIYQAVDEVKSFKSQSKRLANRIYVIVRPVEQLQADAGKGDYQLPSDEQLREYENRPENQPGDFGDGESFAIGPYSYIRPLRELAGCMKQVDEFLKGLSKMNFGSKFWSKSKISDKFNSFNSQLTTLQQSLSFSLQVLQRHEMNDLFNKTFSKTFNHSSMMEQDKADLEADLRDIQEELERMSERTEETNTLVKGLEAQIQLLSLHLTYSQDDTSISFKDFTNIEQFEEGTFGPVYKAEHNKEIKMLVKKYQDNANPSIEELKNQLRLWTKLAVSRYVVQPYGYTMHEDGKMCFVLEFMHLGTLRKVLQDRDRDLSWEVRLGLARDCAQGLYAIHNGIKGKTMLHRAVTSTRFLVNKHYEAKIADNGFVKSQSKINKSVRRNPGDVERDEINYHCPEDTETQFRATVKSEVYKLGVVFYEIASRMKPFQSMEKDGKGLADDKKLAFICEGKNEEPPDDTPEALKDLVKRCRAADPKQRPSTSEIVSILMKATA